jgi:hypothetical protein
MKVYDEQGLREALTKMRSGQASELTPRRSKRAWRIAAGGILILVTLWIWRSGCSCASLMCADITVEEVPSLDGKRIGRVFHRDCGATTSWVTHVALISRNWLLPDSSETVFVGTAMDHGTRGSDGGSEVRVRWQGPRDLLISHHSAIGVYRADSKAFDVTVKYEKF